MCTSAVRDCLIVISCDNKSASYSQGVVLIRFIGPLFG